MKTILNLFMQAIPNFKAASLLFLIIGLTACNRSAGPQARTFNLKGTIVSVDKTEKLLTVDHESIPGFMEAMTMPYRVRNESYLQTLAEGDEINGQIVVGREGTYLDNINVTKKGSGKSNRPVSKFHAPEEGEQVPDFELLNQDGKKVNLNQYRGKSILLTFIYTRCPMPDYCPRVTQNFAVIEKALVKEPAIHAKTHLLSVSFDPKFDTPKVLNEYGRNYIVGGTKAGFDHWEFVVAPEKILPDLAKFFGLLFKEDAGIIDHSMSTAIVSPDGKIYKWYTDNKWTSDEVLKDIRASVSATTAGTGAGH